MSPTPCPAARPADKERDTKKVTLPEGRVTRSRAADQADLASSGISRREMLLMQYRWSVGVG